jgi:hypothetical protein
MRREQLGVSGIARREFLAAAGAAGAGTLLGAWSGRAEAQGDVSGDVVACVAGGAWETAFREHMAKPFSQKYPKVKVHLDLKAFVDLAGHYPVFELLPLNDGITRTC